MPLPAGVPVDEHPPLVPASEEGASPGPLPVVVGAGAGAVEPASSAPASAWEALPALHVPALHVPPFEQAVPSSTGAHAPGLEGLSQRPHSPHDVDSQHTPSTHAPDGQVVPASIEHVPPRV